MAATGYVLSDSDREYMRAVVSDWLQRNTPNRSRGGDAIQDQEQPAPEVYAGVAVGVIDGAVGGTPGGGRVEIRQMIDYLGQLKELNTVFTVYNAGPVPVPSGGTVLIARDKFGTWWVVVASVGGSTGGGSRVEVVFVRDTAAIGDGDPGTGTGTGTAIGDGNLHGLDYTWLGYISRLDSALEWYNVTPQNENPNIYIRFIEPVQPSSGGRYLGLLSDQTLFGNPVYVAQSRYIGIECGLGRIDLIP